MENITAFSGYTERPGFLVNGSSREVTREIEGGELLIDNAKNFPELFQHESEKSVLSRISKSLLSFSGYKVI